MSLLNEVLSEHKLFISVWDKIMVMAIENNQADVLEEAIAMGADVTAMDNLAIRYAYKSNNPELAKILIASGADALSKVEYCGEMISPLEYASKYGCLEIVEIGLNHGLNPSENNSKSLILACSASNGKINLNIIKKLIENGADASVSNNLPIKNISSQCMLSSSNEKEVKEVISLLAEKGADVTQIDSHFLIKALQNNQLELSRYLLESGVSIEPVRLGIRTIVPIFEIVRFGDLDLFKLAEKSGTNIKAVNRDNHNVVLTAIESGNLDVLKYYHESIEPIGDYRLSPLLLESIGRNPEVSKYLISLGADVNFVSEHHIPRTPYEKAMRYQSFEEVNILLENGLDLENQYHSEGDQGYLYMAVDEQHVEIAEKLIKMGVDVKNDKLSVIRAAETGNVEIMELMQSNGANIKVKNNTPLMNAVFSGHLNMVKYLVKMGCNIGVRNFEAVNIIKRKLEKSFASNEEKEILKYFVDNAHSLLRPSQLKNLSVGFNEQEISQIKRNILNEQHFENDISSQYNKDNLML